MNLPPPGHVTRRQRLLQAKVDEIAFGFVPF
jgi:hypothetical protein